MKLKESKNQINERLENFKKKRMKEDVNTKLSVVDNKLEDEIDKDNVVIEVPVLLGSAMRDIKKLHKIVDDNMKEAEKSAQDFVGEEEKRKKETEKKATTFKESLDKEFKDLYVVENNNYTVKCKGRKELRNLIEQCKQNNIRYKFTKLIEGDYKYNLKFKLVENKVEQPNNNSLKLNEEKYSDEEFEIIENALYDAGLDPTRFNDMGVLTKNLGWVVNANGKTIYLSCDGTWLEESLKEGYYDVTVGELKEILNDVLNKLNQMNDDENLDVKANTYRIGDPYISIASRGFIDLAQLEDKSKTYYYVELNKDFYDSFNTKEEAIEIASQLYEDGEGDVVVFKDINDGYDTEELWSNGELVESVQKKETKPQIKENLEVVGDLDDYTPWGRAVDLYNIIVDEGMLNDLKVILNKLYPDGVKLEQLNDLLSYEQDFIKSMLGLDDVVTTADMDDEFEKETIENIKVEDSEVNNEVKEEENKEIAKSEYLNDKTGYGDDEDNVDGLEDLIDSGALDKEEKED